MIVAHRGDMQNCPENVLRSYISAAKSGADVIELDVFLTKDGYLAINHDTTTSKWDKKLTVTESTRAQLKALKNTQSSATAEDEFTFYEEVVDYFSKNYPDVVFLVEIKDKRNAVIDKVYEVTKAAGMLDRILIICTNHSIVRYAYQTYGVAVQMNRSYIHDKNDLKATLAYACEEVVALNSSFFTVWGDCIYDLNKSLRHRGIKYSPWTTTTAAATDSDFALGYPEFTTNTPHHVDGYARYLRAEVSAGGEVKVWRVNYDGSERLVTDEVKLIVLDGDVSFRGGKITGSGSFAFSYSSKIGNYTYEICSQSLMTTKR
jgi:glycerophosphoryl diester phosphodiesterase